MYEQHRTRRYADSRAEHRSRPRQSQGVGDRPDRIALWAVLMAVVAMVAAFASSNADGATGGIGHETEEQQTSSGSCDDSKFGKRLLSLGDCGTDVKTLNWILKSQRDANPAGKRFKGKTERSVRKFQRRKGIGKSGIVDKRTKRKLIRTMDRERATWYGPGFYGNKTACGQTLKRKTVGVAHKTLPCGSRVTVKYKGRFLRTRVIDRGPYAHGAHWDLTNGARKALGFEGTGDIRVASIG